MTIIMGKVYTKEQIAVLLNCLMAHEIGIVPAFKGRFVSAAIDLKMMKMIYYVKNERGWHLTCYGETIAKEILEQSKLERSDIPLLLKS